MKKQNPDFIIITGGPGGGKSTLIDALRSQGYRCVNEVARDIIIAEAGNDGEALPWKNKEKFKDRMFQESVRIYEAQTHNQTVFFDRGIIDSLAYARLIGAQISEEEIRKAYELQFHPLVFVAPPWEEIYCNDTERKQTFDEAVETYELIVDIYREYGYQTVDLPKVSVEKRIDFIMSCIKTLAEGSQLN